MDWVFSLEQKVMKVSYHYGCLMDTTQNPLINRIYGAAIPVICGLSELSHCAADGCRALDVCWQSLHRQSFETGNLQTTMTLLGEHVRNIAGVVAGLFLGILAPKMARQVFLTVAAAQLSVQLTPISTAQLYVAGYGTDAFLKRHNLRYVLQGGSLMGEERHGGIIPWDDDMDLNLHPDDYVAFKDLVDDGTFERETGLSICWQPMTGGWQAFHPDSPKGEGELERTGLPFIDIFGCKFEEDRIVFRSDLMKQLGTEDYMTTAEWTDSRRVKFGPIEMDTLPNPVPYIKRLYGVDALDFAYQVLHHSKMAEVYKRPWDIIGHVRKLADYGLPRRAFLVDRSPAKYDEEYFQEELLKVKARLEMSAKPEIVEASLA